MMVMVVIYSPSLTGPAHGHSDLALVQEEPGRLKQRARSVVLPFFGDHP